MNGRHCTRKNGSISPKEGMKVPKVAVLLVFLGSFILFGFPAKSGVIVIDNGLAPPNPENVIDADNSFPGDFVRIYDSPGGFPTTVEIVDGGFVYYGVNVYDTSRIIMSGGQVNSIGVSTAAYAELSGGSVVYGFNSAGEARISGGEIGAFLTCKRGILTMTGGAVTPHGPYEEEGWLAAGYPASSGTIHLSGGTIADYLVSFNQSVIYIQGRDFLVDGNPVPYGPLAADTGVLQGVLASGDALYNVFYIGDATAPGPFAPGQQTGGSIYLVPIPEPSVPALPAIGRILLGLGLVGLALRKKFIM